jgi:hypothetical protein
MVFSRGHRNDKRERMEFPAWSRIVVDLPLSYIYYRSSPSMEHSQVMAELRAFPNLLHVHLNHSSDALMSSRPVLTQERRCPFRLYIIHTWCLRGASRGRDKLPVVYFAAIVPCKFAQIPYLETPCYGDKDRSASSF